MSLFCGSPNASFFCCCLISRTVYDTNSTNLRTSSDTVFIDCSSPKKEQLMFDQVNFNNNNREPLERSNKFNENFKDSEFLVLIILL